MSILVVFVEVVVGGGGRSWRLYSRRAQASCFGLAESKKLLPSRTTLFSCKSVWKNCVFFEQVLFYPVRIEKGHETIMLVLKVLSVFLLGLCVASAEVIYDGKGIFTFYVHLYVGFCIARGPYDVPGCFADEICEFRTQFGLVSTFSRFRSTAGDDFQENLHAGVNLQDGVPVNHCSRARFLERGPVPSPRWYPPFIQIAV